MKIRKIIALVLSVIMLCSSVSVSAFAETTSQVVEVSPYYKNAQKVTNILSISSSTAECKSTCKGFSDVVQITVEQTLQKFWGLWIWNNVDGANWSKTEKTNSIVLSGTKSGLTSGTYRLKSVFTLTNSSGKTETITIYSDEKKIS